ncbi:MAG: glucosamine-6-phosphate deaminase [Elusimicrobiota bacterium]|jgi:glucosamine-6-phosphate deaminase|nr:glucosamine-6-phosphate deaminase [Elusimicrobiota bacterium]
MRLIITDKNVGHLAAFFVKERMAAAKPTENKNFVLGLPTGSTAIDMYKSLIELYRRKEIYFDNVTTFNLDEYVGLPEDDKESYHTFMYENFFKYIKIDKKKINIPNGNAPDLIKEGEEYEEKIAKAGGLDLFIGGLGENGHVAFNEPYSSLSSITRDKQLDKNTIIANSRFFGNDPTKVPKTAMTMGMQTILNAKEVLLLVTGEKKALALKHLVEGAISHAWPATVLQMHRKLVVIVDEASCNELTLKTYRYFKRLKDEFSHIYA